MKRYLHLILIVGLLAFTLQTIKTQQSSNTSDLTPDILQDNILEHTNPVSNIPTESVIKGELKDQNAIRVDDREIGAAPDEMVNLEQIPSNKDKKRWTIDKIIARVNGVNILKSDLEQPRIAKEGGHYNLDELILEEMFFQKASEKHLMPTVADVDRQIVSIKIQNEMGDMPEEEFERQLKDSGFTMLTYKQQLGRLLAVENIKRAEVSEKIVVSSQQVEEYYHKNPEYLPEEYLLEIASLGEKEVAQYKKLAETEKLSWQNLGWVEKGHLDKQYAMVLTMKKDTISKPIKKGNQHYVVKLVDKQERRLKPLDQCYGEIERILHVAKRDKLFNKLQKEVREKATVIYL